MTLPTEKGHAAPPVESRESCESVNPYLVSFPVLRHIEPQAPLLGGAHVDTTTTRVEWMDRETTTNDNDAIDADMHARAGDAELIPWLSSSRIVHHTFHFASDTEAEMLS